MYTKRIKSGELKVNAKSLGLWLAFGIWSVCQGAFATPDPIVRQYAVEVDFRKASERTVTGTLTLKITNASSAPLTELVWMAHANRYRESLPYLNDLNTFRLYPDGVSEGALDVQGQIAGGSALTFEVLPKPDLPDRTFLKSKLANPLAPGETATFNVQFKLLVPEKFGSVGWYRGEMTLAGGWLPILASYRDNEGFKIDEPPPLANWNVLAKISAPTVISGALFLPAPGQEEVQKTSEGHDVSVVVRPKLKMQEVSGRRDRVQIIYPENESGWATTIREAVVKWLDYMDSRDDLPRLSRPLVLTYAPLRETLFSPAEGMALISDRAFKVTGGLRQYHSVPVIRSLFYQLAESISSPREASRDFNWVADLISWVWVERYMSASVYDHRDARTLPLIRLFSFLFTIDRLIYAPQFAFDDVFFDLIYPYDPVRDHPLLFNHQRPQGRTILAHAQDEMGNSRVEEAVDRYATSAGRFETEASLVAKRDLTKEFSRWVAPRPAVNYVLKSHITKTEGKQIHHEVTAARESREPFREPCEIGVLLKDGQQLVFRWDDDQAEKTFSFTTESPIDIIEIDPRHRLRETTLSDNRSPPKYKLTLQDYVVNYDVNRNVPTGFASVQFRRSYGGNNRYNLSASYFGDAYGVDVTYIRLFGRLIDSLRLSHGIGIGYGFRQLDEENVRVADPTSGNSTVVQTGPSTQTSSISASYFFGDQLSLTNPLEGGGVSLGAAWGNSYMGGEQDYYRVTFDGSWIWPIHPSYFMAFRGVLGHVGPSSIPTQLYYDLGGLYGMRGLTENEAQFEGRNLLLTSAEFRHLLVRDIDINLWLFRVRSIQGVLFTDVGRVSYTAEERANELAFGVAPSSGFGDVFDFKNLEADAGYSIHFFLDMLGVNPGLFRVDVAKGLTTGGAARFYFGVTQSY